MPLSLLAPAIPTLDEAIRRGNLITFPGIDNINFKKYVGANVANAKGHLDQERVHLRSTKSNNIQNFTEDQVKQDEFPQKATKGHDCYAVIIPAPEKGMSYLDQTGSFPYKSSRGNKRVWLK